MTSKRSSRVFGQDTLLPERASFQPVPRSTCNSNEDLKGSEGAAGPVLRNIETVPVEESLGSSTSSTRSSRSSLTDIASSRRSDLEVSIGLPLMTTGRPDNFGVIEPGVYRSSYPKLEDFAFLQGLKLKTVITLAQKEDKEFDLKAFIAENSIRQFAFGMKGTRKEAIPMQMMKAIIAIIHDTRNHPLLLHCNQGKHRTGCVVGVMRKLSGWKTSSVLDEYRHYATPKVRECDLEYLTAFSVTPPEGTNVDRSQSCSHGRRTFIRVFALTIVAGTIWIVSAASLARKNYDGT